MVSTGWLCLAAMIMAYGVANLLQSVAATRTRPQRRLHPGLLLRLATHRVYLVGLTFQLFGFCFAFVARRELPLFLVQASVAAGLGVTAILGVLVLRWRLPAAEVALLGGLGIGVASLVIAARPAPSRQIGPAGEIAIAMVVALIAIAGAFAARLRGAPGSVALGGLAGFAFGAVAVCSRSLAGMHSVHDVITSPLIYLLAANSAIGQLMIGLAMQRGCTTAAVAAMDAASSVPAAVIGIVLLGDRVWPGMQWLAVVGFAVTLLAVLGLTRYAQPQHVWRRRDRVALATAEPAPEQVGAFR